jgi:hypothetical protein
LTVILWSAPVALLKWQHEKLAILLSVIICLGELFFFVYAMIVMSMQNEQMTSRMNIKMNIKLNVVEQKQDLFAALDMKALHDDALSLAKSNLARGGNDKWDAEKWNNVHKLDTIAADIIKNHFGVDGNRILVFERLYRDTQGSGNTNANKIHRDAATCQGLVEYGGHIHGGFWQKKWCDVGFA